MKTKICRVFIGIILAVIAYIVSAFIISLFLVIPMLWCNSSTFELIFQKDIISIQPYIAMTPADLVLTTLSTIAACITLYIYYRK